MTLIRLCWALTFGLVLGACFYAAGIVLCATVIGIPFGIAMFVAGWKLQTLS